MLAQVFCRVFVAVTSRGSDEEMEFLKAIAQRQCGGTFGPLPSFAHMFFRAWSDAHFVSHRHHQPVAGNWRFQSDRQARHDSTAAPQRPVVATPQQPSFIHNAVAEIRLLKSAVAALGEDSPHASFLLTATNAARAKLNVPISARIELSEKYLERARNPTNSSRGRSPRSKMRFGNGVEARSTLIDSGGSLSREGAAESRCNPLARELVKAAVGIGECGWEKHGTEVSRVRHRSLGEGNCAEFSSSTSTEFVSEPPHGCSGCGPA